MIGRPSIALYRLYPWCSLGLLSWPSILRLGGHSHERDACVIEYATGSDATQRAASDSYRRGPSRTPLHTRTQHATHTRKRRPRHNAASLNGCSTTWQHYMLCSSSTPAVASTPGLCNSRQRDLAAMTADARSTLDAGGGDATASWSSSSGK